MNTEPSTNPAPADLPDYQLAARELAAYFATLGITATISGQHAAIDEDGGIGGKGWTHVALTVTFSRPAANGRDAVLFSTPYKMGTGLADWARILARLPKGSDEYPRIQAMMGRGSLSPEAQRDLCAKYLPAFVSKVNPAEVLASVCRDGEDATGRSFEDWAGDYGYETDSRKAERVYEACQQGGDKTRKLLAHAPGAVAKLAELAGRL